MPEYISNGTISQGFFGDTIEKVSLTISTYLKEIFSVESWKKNEKISLAEILEDIS